MSRCRFDCPYVLGTGKQKLSGMVVCLYTEQLQPALENETFCKGKYLYENNTGTAICPTLKKSIALPESSAADPAETSKRKEIIAGVNKVKPPTADYILALCLPSCIPIANVSFAFKHQLFGLYSSGAIQLRKAL